MAKRKNRAYGEGWFKIRNLHYSHYEGRRELFEKKRASAADPCSSSPAVLYFRTSLDVAEIRKESSYGRKREHSARPRNRS